MKIARLNIPISMVCNLHCENCFTLDYAPSKQNRKKFMTLADVRGVLENLERCDVHVGRLTLAGAEPLLNPYFAGIVAAVKAFGPACAEVITNGTLLTREKVDVLATLNRIEISIYPASRGIRTALETSGLVTRLQKTSKVHFRTPRLFRLCRQDLEIANVQRNYDQCTAKHRCTVAVEAGIYKCWVLFQLDKDICPYDKEQLRAYLIRKDAFESCSHCAYNMDEWRACGSRQPEVDAQVVARGIKSIQEIK